MAYSSVWSTHEGYAGTNVASDIDNEFDRLSIAVRERLETIFGTGVFGTDPVTVSKFVYSGATTSKTIPGSTSHSFRDNADVNDNLLINNNGTISLRNTLTITAGGLVVSAGGINITGGGTFSGATQVTFGGSIFIANTSIIDGANSTIREVRYTTGGSTRWKAQCTNTTESGSNAGSDYAISAYSDTGVFLYNPIQIIRATGAVNVVTQIVLDKTSLAAQASFEIRSDAGQSRVITFRTGNSARWQFLIGSGTESGGNAGSDFALNRYDDTGAFLGAPITITRSTGGIVLANDVSVQSRLLLTAAVSKIIPGATSISHRNNADNADNLLITDAGLVTLRNTLSGTIADMSTGFRIGGGAAAGNFLRGNGTNFVSSALQTTDIPSLEAVRAYRNAALSITQSVLTAIAFDAEDYDTGTMHDNVTNPTRLTVPTSGKYRIIGHVSWQGVASNAFIVVRKNGVATDLAKTTTVVANSIQGTSEVSVTLLLSANDYVELYAQSDAPTPVILTGPSLTYFEAVKATN